MNTQSDNSPLNEPEQTQTKNLERKTYLLTVGKREEILFIPCYAALNVKTLSHLNVKEGTMNMDCTFILRIDISKIPSEIADIIEQRLEFRLCEKAFILEKGQTEGLNVNRKNELIVYLYRFSPTIEFMTELSQTPFDKFDIELPIELTSSFEGDREKIKDKSFRNISKYRFNLHLHQNQEANISFKNTVDKLPEFDIKTQESQSFLFPERKEDKHGNFLYRYYPKVVYSIKIIRNPWHLITTVILPLLVIQFVNLGLFMQSNDVNSKLANIATLLLAIVAYIPSVRSEIPSNSYFTLSDIVIYTNVLINGFALLETTLIHFFEEHDVITYYLFGFSVLLIFINFYIISYFALTHELYRRTHFSVGKKKEKKVQAIKKDFGDYVMMRMRPNQKDGHEEVKQSSTDFQESAWENTPLKTVQISSGIQIKIISETLIP